ncbi:hypothetical protein ACIBBE_45965 [Streptomyces sp. NPDC051644]|uniref:hypothetical protein n=1 Tax=Streptomyces sp. NPDC051644 TaxID=3365666 RepID=UPI0037B32625
MRPRTGPWSISSSSHAVADVSLGRPICPALVGSSVKKAASSTSSVRSGYAARSTSRSRTTAARAAVCAAGSA